MASGFISDRHHSHLLGGNCVPCYLLYNEGEFLILFHHIQVLHLLGTQVFILDFLLSVSGQIHISSPTHKFDKAQEGVAYL